MKKMTEASASVCLLLATALQTIMFETAVKYTCH